MESKHTPGPWKYFELEHTKSNDKSYWHIEAGNGFYGSMKNGFEIAGHMSEANARLIAQAPDLRAFAERVATETDLTLPELREMARKILEGRDG